MVDKKKGEFSFVKLNSINVFAIATLLIGLCVACVRCENGNIFEIAQQCEQRCPDQNNTNSDHIDVGCGKDCYINQCTLGCNLWKEALNTSCQDVCNKTETELLEPKELYCVMGCNDALNRYFKWLKAEIKTPHAPALLADSLTATSLSLEWDIPQRIIELAQGNLPTPKTYLVQWRFEEIVGDWKYCRNHSMGENSTVRVDNLRPYTKYRFRVVLLLAPKHEEVLISEQSVVISTLPAGVPESKPQIVRAVAVDHNRITISWEPGPFPNGPILSYVLQISDQNSHIAIKDIPSAENTRFYMFEKLTPSTNYTISVTMRNAEGEGPVDSVIVPTPDKPEQSDSQVQPTLILATEDSIISQSSDMLMESPTKIYESNYKIVGMAVFVLKKLIFFADSSQSIYKISTERYRNQTATKIMSREKQNFKPTLLSLDWLNEHLYILGEVESNGLKSYQISRCDLNGNGFVVAIAGLLRRPSCIQVDSYNGYLFWTVSGKSKSSGLFSLDLADISNGIKHEDRPTKLIQGNNLGAFVVAHASFNLYVPFQDTNTIISMTVKGGDLRNVRNNTQSPKFHSVKSLAWANDLFYWTNGHEVLTEEYHAAQDSYYHNKFSENRTFVAVCVNLSSTQPIPTPLNPPSKVQALMSTSRAKITWMAPHLLEYQGRGAWQAWKYALQIMTADGSERVIRSIKDTTYVADQLEPDTEYTFRVAAYSPGATGQWSTEFKSRTLKATDNRLLLWSSMDGLYQSDMMGEHFQTLIGKAQLEEGYITDVTWFEDTLYVVSNSTMRIYNHSFGEAGISSISLVRKIESVESVAVDWIGKRLYWSNPTQQLITRSNLTGDQQEPLPILTLAKEIKIDALEGWIYYSTGHAVEACRLNGKDKHVFVQLQLYSGKQIMGLTLDIENHKLFWIVRSYEQSTLYSASTDNLKQLKINYFEKTLNDSNLEGPLTHFSNRLLWLQNNETVIIGDMEANYLAKIHPKKLSALKSISIIDPSHHVYPSTISNRVNVIPEAVNNATIKINPRGQWNNFNITWTPIRNVNYGQVFYELRIHVKRGNSKDILKEVAETTFRFPQSLAPYSALEITIRAFTYWGSSTVARTELTSPVNYPAAPSNPRVFLAQNYELMLGRRDIEAILRWNVPRQPNGPIEGYRIAYKYEEDGMEKQDNATVAGDVHEYIVRNLVHNVTYQFKFIAFTKIGDGSATSVSLTTNQEQPVPKVLAANDDQIAIIDLDLPKTIPVINTGNAVRFMTPLQLERRIFWVNVNNEIMSHAGQAKSKLWSVGATVFSMNIDWIMRVLYWSQDVSSGYAIYSLDLNRFEKEKQQPVMFYTSLHKITNLVVSPMDMKVFWIETAATEEGDVSLIITKATDSKLEDMAQEFLNASVPCYTSNMSSVRQTLALDSSMDTGPSLIWADSTNTFYSTKVLDKECYPIGLRYNETMHNSVRDSDRTYWIDRDNELLWAQNTNDKVVYSYNATGYRELLSFYHQNYPERKCLVPLQQQQKYRVILLERYADSLLVQLPKPQMHSNCSLKPASVKYTIYLKTYHEADGDSCDNCTVIETYESTKRIEGLASFTKYRIQVGLSNYYSEKLMQATRIGPFEVFSTSPGQPSPPRDVNAEAISPNEVVVNWTPPEHFNGDMVRYEVHMRTENTLTNLKNKQQQLVSDYEPVERQNRAQTLSLTKLLPNHSYTIWVRAYTSDTTFSESETIDVETFPEPNNITKTNQTPYTMVIQWRPDDHISKYVVQYSMAGSTNWKTVFDSQSMMHQRPGDDSDGHFLIADLQPKTQYRFVILIFYAKRKDPYTWPSDSRFEFETLGDSPTAPGKPLIKLLQEETYQISWEPAKENGAQIDEYNLEVRRSLQPTVVRAMYRRSAPSNILEVTKEDLETETATDLNEATETEAEAMEHDILDQQWHIHYNGTEAFTVVRNLNPINDYAFRVRARNSYGWGPFSAESTHVTAPLVGHYPDNNYLMISFITVPAVLIVCLVVLLVFYVFQCRRRKMNEKILYPDTATAHLPDFELANLRELPRRGINSTNILYTSGPLTDSEIALLPQIKRDQITMTDFLGSGAFGEVYEGIVNCVGEEPETRVAIKTLRKGATEQEKGEFLQEAQLMSNFKHEHILKLIGICLDHDSLYIIMELMQGGDLLSFLRQSRPVIETPSSLSLLDLISMCVDVAAGCRYLEEMHFVHRDLACRNCLVSSVDPATRVVKIGDFGLARDIYKNDYYRKEGEGLLPVRWMSPESLVYGVFTSQSDIWAFGVLCWEIMTLGQQPYPARNNVEVLHYVRNGGRLEQPTDCPEELHQLMLLCWSYSPDDRPTFRYCLEVLQALQLRTSDSIQIMSQFPCKTAAVSNKSYFIQDINHNHQGMEGTFKYPLINSNGSIIQTSATSHTVPSIPPPPSQLSTIPKYLELVYDASLDNFGQQQQQQQHQQPQQQTPPPIINDYEKPITDLLINQSNRNSFNATNTSTSNPKERTFSSSSTVSNLSCTTPLPSGNFGCANNGSRNNLKIAGDGSLRRDMEALLSSSFQTTIIADINQENSAGSLT